MPDTSTTAVLHSARRTALANGVLIDATKGDFAAVSREHFPDRHLAMTSAVFALIEQASTTRTPAISPRSGTKFSGVRMSVGCAPSPAVTPSNSAFPAAGDCAGTSSKSSSTAMPVASGVSP